MHYFVHNGFCSWAYGTPAAPQRITAEDALELMRRANLTLTQVQTAIPPAQFAEEGSPLFRLLGNHRFLFYGEAADCAEVCPERVSEALKIQWPTA